MIWAAVVVGSLGCYLLKLAGLSVPQRILDDDRVARVALLLPTALLGSLIAIETLTVGHRLTVDARVAGLAVAAVAQVLRAPFLVVVIAAVVTTALVRLAA